MQENEKWFLISAKQLTDIYGFLNNLVTKVSDAVPALDAVRSVTMNKFDLEAHFIMKRELEAMKEIARIDLEADEKNK